MFNNNIYLLIMKLASLTSAILLFIISCRHEVSSDTNKLSYARWEAYAGSKDGSRYSSLDEINTKNVSKLRLAWKYSTHDKDTGNRSQIQCNPIIIDGILYGISACLKIFALDAATGKEKWIFDPAREDSANQNDQNPVFSVSRGIACWQSQEGKDSRLFYGVGPRVYCLNMNSGKPVRSFGTNGYIDLTRDLDSERDPSSLYVAVTTPGIVYKNLIILGMRVGETEDAAPGHIRAYNVITGKKEWIFHTIPQPGEKGYDTWPDKNEWKNLGGANCWAGFSLDEERGIVYIPTGSIGGDFYGGFREGTNLFANSLIALDASTGKYLWHYQTVHHDLWDRDLPANPNLITLHQHGNQVKAIAQITKQGYIFVFDGYTGKPLFDIVEKPVSQQALPGEKPWSSQPFPVLPSPFARQKFDEEDITDISPEAHAEMLEKYKSIKHKVMFTPPSKEGSWIFPGFDGGGEWGGASVDPETGIMYVNCSELPWSLTMIDVPKDADGNASGVITGRSVYNRNCIACHSLSLKGNGSTYPSLLNLSKKYNAFQVEKIILNGKNMMPAFKQIPVNEKDALIAFLLNQQSKEATKIVNDRSRLEPAKKIKEGANDSLSGQQAYSSPYVMTGYNRFLDRNGYPGIKPPWGTLNAIDLNTGKLLWKVPLGEYPELSKKGIPVTGTENYGGPINTKGGLIFIAASRDSRIRAFDKNTGKVLWEAELPVPGFATPATYFAKGRQYVVIACGGGKIGCKSGDEYLAFSLP